MKTRKSSLSLILALVMVFVMASGALAAAPNAYFLANQISIPNASGDVTVSGDSYLGLCAWGASGDITYTGGTVKTDGEDASGAYAYYGTIQATGNIITSGDRARGLFLDRTGNITWVGDISTDGLEAHGVHADRTSSVDITGNIETKKNNSYGIYSYRNSYIKMAGNIITHGIRALGVLANDNASIEFVGNSTTHEESAHAIAAYNNSTVSVTGDASALGINAGGIVSTQSSTVTMTNGSITVSDESSYGIYVGADGVVNLENVTAVVGDGILLKSGTNLTSASGVVNASGSTLEGDILHTGATADTLAVNLIDSVWNGSAEAVDDIGVINIDLGNSQWNVTGDTNTNGKITGDADSKVDFNGTDENITVIIDRLEGESGISVKPGDKLIIKNPNGNIESSNPDVIEVVENEDGSVEIISKGDGEADLTYQYIDENGKIQTVTVKVVSGAGSQPAASGGGGSSNCNTGVGAALFALFGLALIQKRK